MLELSYMPGLLAKHADMRSMRGGILSAPKELARWRELIGRLMAHLVERYGEETVSLWLFSPWLPPDFADMGLCNREEYADIYAASYHAIRAAVPRALIVGPGSVSFLECWPRYLEMCRSRDCMPDILSFRSFAAVGEGEEEGMKLIGNNESFPFAVSADENFLAHTAVEIRGILKQDGLENMPLIVEEWSNNIWQRDLCKVEDYHGAPVLVKYLPDSDERGAMDPRLYADQKKTLRMMAWMPSFLMKMDTSPKGIANLRKMFNGIKSIPCVDAPISIEKRTVPAADGYEIPVRIYKENPEDTGKTILYYIHGGGFFGGSPDVVEESVKMFVAKSGLCAVSVDYRLAPENPYPTGHQDCYRVLQWIGENAASFGGDGEHIFVAGDSAGGNLTQYCTTRDREEGGNLVKGQLLLYPTVNMAGVKDELYQPGMEHFEMAPSQRRGLTKMIGMFGGMSEGLEPILGTKDIQNDYLNPYTRDPANNPPTFLTVGEHDFLKLETLGYGVKLHRAGVETKMVLYKGFGHAYIDNTGVYPQCEDCIDEMVSFILAHCQG